MASTSKISGPQKLRLAPRRGDRSGMILVWFALMLVILLGMVGLVMDAGLLMAAQRQAQNAADAAALAAAQDKLLGMTNAQAIAAATTFVQTYNLDKIAVNIPTPQVNIPPASGPYAGKSGYVEVIASFQVKTFLIQLIPGVAQQQTITARGVAGAESINFGEGVAVLDPTARPGFSIGGNARLTVNGAVYSNSEGGGLTQNGTPINNGNSGNSITTNGNHAFIVAQNVSTVGGVNSPSNFINYTSGGPNPLQTGQLPVPDPLQFLPTPTVANGVDPTLRGAPKSSKGSQTLNDPSGKNNIQTVGGVKTMNLFPGIYNSITITGGNVNFYPGIYVVRAQSSGAAVLTISGGTVVANGVMFYDTGNNYNPTTGAPDINDFNATPPATDGALFGTFSISGAVTLTPIDTTNSSYNYGGYQAGAPVPSSVFNGMLIYQRRLNTEPLSLAGNSTSANFTGAYYAKWATVNISGNASYNIQFVVGSMAIAGNGSITLNSLGSSFSLTTQVYLVQ